MRRPTRVLCRIGLHHWRTVRVGTTGGGTIYIRTCERCGVKSWEYRVGNVRRKSWQNMTT